MLSSLTALRYCYGGNNTSILLYLVEYLNFLVRAAVDPVPYNEWLQDSSELVLSELSELSSSTVGCRLSRRKKVRRYFRNIEERYGRYGRNCVTERQRR